MTRQDKLELANLVKFSILVGRSKANTMKLLRGMGFKQRTIGKYYDVFKEAHNDKR